MIKPIMFFIQIYLYFIFKIKIIEAKINENTFATTNGHDCISNP